MSLFISMILISDLWYMYHFFGIWILTATFSLPQIILYFRHGADLVGYLFGGKLDVVLVVSQKTAKSLRLSSLLSNHTINLSM